MSPINHLRFPILFLCTVLACVTWTCKETPSTVSPDNGTTFPLAAGTRWTYVSRDTAIHIVPDSLAQYAWVKQLVDTTKRFVSLEILRRQLLHDTLDTYVCQEVDSSEPGPVLTSQYYYANRDSGLYLYARSGEYHAGLLPFSTFPQVHRLSREAYSTNRRHIPMSVLQDFLRDVGLSDTLYETSPRQALKYPMTVGQEWIYRPSPSGLSRRIVALENVSVPAGVFLCYKIQTTIEDYPGVELFDFLSEKGLIKRSLLIRSFSITTPDGPEVLGVYDLLRETNLVSVTQ